jgi:hypothetical protein
VEDIGRVWKHSDSFARGLWQLVWPLMFVTVMTVLSEYGPEIRDFKTHDNGVPEAAQQVAQWIK